MRLFTVLVASIAPGATSVNRLAQRRPRHDRVLRNRLSPMCGGRFRRLGNPCSDGGAAYCVRRRYEYNNRSLSYHA